MGRWEVERCSVGRANESEKMVGGIIGGRDGKEGTQRGSQAHTTTKQQTEGTECESAATNKHRAMAGGDSAVSVIVV